MPRADQELPFTNVKFPFMIPGYEADPLCSYCMGPLPIKTLTEFEGILITLYGDGGVVVKCLGYSCEVLNVTSHFLIWRANLHKVFCTTCLSRFR